MYRNAETAQPGAHGIEGFLSYVRFLATAASRNVKGMIGILEHVQGGPLSQVLDHRLKEAQVRERVMTSLNEQQRNADLLKVRGPIRTGLAGSMQWESQKHEPADPRERSLCLCLRSHTTAEGPATGK